MISVVMGVYNEKNVWIQQAVESILNQTYKDIEFIIIIDNPDLPDEIKEYLKKKKCENSCISLIWNQVNEGLAGSLNKGISLARGEYIARMDADDISEKTRLEKELDFLLRNHFDMVSANKVNINEEGIPVSRDGPVTRDPGRVIMYVNPVIHSSVLIRKEVLLALGGYRELVNSEDWDLWIRLVEQGYKIGILNEHLLQYRERKNGASSGRQLEQFYSSGYLIRLYRERKRCQGADSFSVENMTAYLKSKDMSNRKKKRFAKARCCLRQAVNAKKQGHGIRCICKICMSGIHFPALVCREGFLSVLAWWKQNSWK